MLNHVSKNFFQEGDTLETYFSAAPPEMIINYFLNPPSITDMELNFNQRADIKKLTSFLVEERNFSEDRVANRLAGLVKKQKQRSLNSFF